ncbi:MAG: rRNA maturation RNase YbeY [Chitinispirillaceae bacterium]|nr:rRNA maturation RNase YbeY [Chitinispirillaceae bacterium]
MSYDRGNPLRIFTSGRLTALPERKLRRVTAAVYLHEKIEPSRKINLICCSDYTIRKLNRAYRRTDRTTDVLSFSFNENDLLGEIYISWQRTEVQARRFCVSFNNEFIRLFIHGLFHLAGYDHCGQSERTVMEKKVQFFLDQVK